MKGILLTLIVIVNAVVCSAQPTALFFPQIADGTFPGGSWKTSLFFTNAAVAGIPAAQVTIRFIRSDGSPFAIAFQDDQGALLPASDLLSFQVPPGQTRKFVSTSQGALATGFAALSANVTVAATAVFSQFDGVGRLLGEAGVPSAGALSRQIVFVDTLEGFKTGLAFANPNPTAADVTLQLLNRGGQELTGAVTQRLQPNQHLAQFVDQIFPPMLQLVGVVQIVSSQPLAAVGLRFDPSSTLFTTLPAAPLYAPAVVGRYTGILGVSAAFSIELSPDNTLTQISGNGVGCDFHSHTFTVNVSPGIPIVGQRFTARDIPVAIAGHGHTLDIDGVFFDADGFGGTPEQGLGGVSFLTNATRCNFRWVASTLATDDGDGWSSAAERRLGSDPANFFRTPEHKDVPTTALSGPDTCHDVADNDGDGRIDQSDADCAGATPVAIAAAP